MLTPSSFVGGLCLVVLAAFSAAGCEKPDLDECRRACWNYNQVMYWAAVDREVETMPAAEAAKHRAKKEAEFRRIEKREEDQGLMNCVYDCQHNSNDKQITCMKTAKKEAALKSCLE